MVKYNKYRNIKTVVDGIKFESKAEADYYGLLKILKKHGEVESFEMQVEYVLTAGIKYRLDFLVKYTDGHTEYIDIKGVKTDVFKLKARLMKHDHGITIVCLKRLSAFAFKNV